MLRLSRTSAVASLWLIGIVGQVAEGQLADPIFGDFSTEFVTPAGRLFSGDLDTGEIEELVLGNNDRDLGLFIKGFGQDLDGELYLMAGTNLGPFGTSGEVFKIVPVPEPTALRTLLAGLIAFVMAWAGSPSRGRFYPRLLTRFVARGGSSLTGMESESHRYHAIGEY